MMKTYFAAIMMVLCTCFPSSMEASRAPLSKKSHPNIIYIVAEGLGFDELGCYGQTVIETPNIDAWIREGMSFTHYYLGQATAVGSRYSLLTGLHGGHSYIRGNDEMQERGDVWDYWTMLSDSTMEGQRALPESTVMLPQKLKEAGYTTACLGKWGLGYPGSVSTPNKMGFDYFYGYNCERQAQTYYPPFLYRNDRRVYLNNQFLEPGVGLDSNDDAYDPLNYERYSQQDYAPEKIYQEVLKFIRQNQETPFALIWTSPLPDGALQVPERWLSYYQQKVGDEPPFPGNRRYTPCRYPKATYAAMVSLLDEQIGGLLRLLKELDLYENTLLVFTGGNRVTDDIYVDELETYRSEIAVNRRISGKLSLAEKKLHVPMIVSWPKEIVAGTTSGILTSSYDVMATFCDLAHIEAPVTDGISIYPALLGKNRKQKEHECLYWEHSASDGEVAVRFGSWKAIVGEVMKGNRTIRLFDMQTDPNEQCDVAAQNPEIVEQALQFIKREHTSPHLKIFDFPTW